MTPLELHQHVATYTGLGLLRQIPFRVVVHGRVRKGGTQRVRVGLLVEDTSGGGRREFWREAMIGPLATGSDVDRAVFGALVELLVHEVGEGFTRDGVRVFDPHCLPRVWPWATK